MDGSLSVNKVVLCAHYFEWWGVGLTSGVCDGVVSEVQGQLSLCFHWARLSSLASGGLSLLVE